MSAQITIQVSDQVVRHAAHVAAQTQRQIEEVLADWLERVITETPVEELSDAEVIALTELQLTEEQQTLLGDLLVRNGVYIYGITPTGRWTVAAPQLNNELAVEVRRNWILAGIRPRCKPTTGDPVM